MGNKIEFACPICDGGVEATEEFFGRAMTCPHCGEALVAPEVLSSSMQSDAMPARGDGWRRLSRGVIVAASLIAIFLVGVAIFASTRKTEVPVASSSKPSETSLAIETRGDEAKDSQQERSGSTMGDHVDDNGRAEPSVEGRDPSKGALAEADDAAQKLAKLIMLYGSIQHPVRKASDGLLGVVQAYRSEGNAGYPTAGFIAKNFPEPKITTLLGRELRYTQEFESAMLIRDQAAMDLQSAQAGGGTSMGSSAFTGRSGPNSFYDQGRQRAQAGMIEQAAVQYQYAEAQFQAIARNYVTL